MKCPQKTLFLRLFLLFVLSVGFAFTFTTPASAARVSRPITYWTSKGASWNQSYPQDGIDFAYNSEGNNWYITPTPFRYSEASWAANLWFLRGWFSTSQSLANKRGARFTLSVIMYPNDDSNKWTCGDRSGLLAYVTGDNVTSRAEHVRCQKYDSDTFRLWATFTLTPTNGEVFSSNPNLYFTFESEAKDLGIFNFDGYVVSSGLTSVHQNALMLVDHVDEDDLVLFTDPNTGLLENVVDKLDQQTEVIEREGSEIRSTIESSTDDIIASQQQTTSAINNLNLTLEENENDAQSRWEQDKQEQVDKQAELESATENQLDIINFNLTNPFEALFDLFRPPDSCVNIPIIADLIHSPTSVYCSWWSSSVTSILTPVIGLSASMLLFGFFIKWLKGEEDITI